MVTKKKKTIIRGIIVAFPIIIGLVSLLFLDLALQGGLLMGIGGALAFIYDNIRSLILSGLSSVLNVFSGDDESQTMNYSTNGIQQKSEAGRDNYNIIISKKK